ECSRRMADVGKAETAYSIVPETFVMALARQYDAFLGRLLRCLYLKKPELLNESDKQICYGNIIYFDSIDNAKECILVTEIEGVIRKSHAEQFAWMENKFKLKLREELAIWSTFIELTERRNLFAHCNGHVSNQYITVCKQHGIAAEHLPEVGKRLSVDDKYMT